VLGWLAIIANERLTDVSTWALLLVCANPVQEVLFSAWRRRWRHKHWVSLDRLHLHSLVGRRLVRAHLGATGERACNSITGLVMVAINALPVGWALTWPSNGPALACGLLLNAFTYHIIYVRLICFRWSIDGKTARIAALTP
jgi:hypothetical protein